MLTTYATEKSISEKIALSQQNTQQQLKQCYTPPCCTSQCASAFKFFSAVFLHRVASSNMSNQALCYISLVQFAESDLQSWTGL